MSLSKQIYLYSIDTSYLYEEKVFADLTLSANPCWKLEDFRKF